MAIGSYKKKIEHAGHLTFPITDNEAEYEALLAGFHIAKVVRAEKVEIYTYSQSITKKVNGDFQI